MKALIDAVVALIKATPSLAAFAGVAPGGALGPFWGIAPELTPFPTTVITQIPGLSNLYGFNTGTYVEPIQLQFGVRDVVPEMAVTNAEALCATLDVLTSLTLASGTTLASKPFRTQPVRLINEGISGSGQRVYHALVVYTFRIQRTKGS